MNENNNNQIIIFQTEISKNKLETDAKIKDLQYKIHMLNEKMLKNKLDAEEKFRTQCLTKMEMDAKTEELTAKTEELTAKTEELSGSNQKINKLMGLLQIFISRNTVKEYDNGKIDYNYQQCFI